MALLCFNSLTPFTFSSSSSSTSTLAIATTAVFSSCNKPLELELHSKYFSGLRIQTPFIANKTSPIIVRAASDVDGGGAPTDGGETPSDGNEGGAVPVDKMPLESKLKEREEQRLRMKLAKKIRLRRKRLVRKRRLRKKGRWPPSKMNKLKNV